MELSKEYARAYREVFEILKLVSKEDRDKIPKEKLEFYYQHMDTSYDYQIDSNRPFAEQNISDITEAILANLFRDYWATPYQRERIIAKEQYDRKRLEDLKSQRHNPNNIFNKK